MKRERELIELSEDEWTPHRDSFKPSRVLKPNPPPSNPPPPIESFAFSNNEDTAAADIHDIHVIESSSSDDSRGAAAGNGDGVEDLEDEDAEFEVSKKRASTSTRGNKFVIDDDDEEDDGGGGGGDADGDFSDNEAWVEEGEETEEDDVVKKALLKCGKISAELKQELYGTSAIACDQYSEVELDSSAAAKIVTQVRAEVFNVVELRRFHLQHCNLGFIFLMTPPKLGRFRTILLYGKQEMEKG